MTTFLFRNHLPSFTVMAGLHPAIHGAARTVRIGIAAFVAPLAAPFAAAAPP
jgi:hypothetical protein